MPLVNTLPHQEQEVVLIVQQVKHKHQVEPLHVTPASLVNTQPLPIIAAAVLRDKRLLVVLQPVVLVQTIPIK